MKKYKIALTPTAASEWETQNYVELGILWIIELIDQEYDKKLCQGLTPQRDLKKSFRGELQEMSQGNLQKRFENDSGEVVSSYWKGNLREKPVREQSVCLRNGSKSDKGKEEKSLLGEVMLSQITQHINWIKLSAN